MENVRDDYIIRSMMETGFPPWMQETMDGVREDEEIQELPESCMDVLAHLMFGKDNAISRTELSIKTGLSDRQVRRSIEILRRDYLICNDQDGKGYYRPRDTKEIRRYFKQEDARAKAILRRLKLARQVLVMRGAL